MQKTAKEWVELLVTNGCPASEVTFAEEMSDDPHVQATQMMVDLDHPS